MPALADRRSGAARKAAARGSVRSPLVRAGLARTPGRGDPKKFLAVLDSFPLGTMSAPEIDREIEEVRASRLNALEALVGPLKKSDVSTQRLTG